MRVPATGPGISVCAGTAVGTATAASGASAMTDAISVLLVALNINALLGRGVERSVQRQVKSGKYRELRLARASMRHCPLWFDEEVVDVSADFCRLARAEAKRDVVLPVLDVKGPDAGRSDVPASREVMDHERLEGDA